MKKISQEDLEHIWLHTSLVWEKFRGKSIFLTGGTGFFGKWLIESFLYANTFGKLDAKLTVLSRNPDIFLSELPWLKNNKALLFVKGDILDFSFEGLQKHQFIIHAATAASDLLNRMQPSLMLDTIKLGTERILSFAVTQPLESILFISSGAVYGKQPERVTHIKETDRFINDINEMGSAYAEGKFLAELSCANYYEKFKLPVKIARCFAFAGPYLPIDSHFAIGNFISNILHNEDIIIKGDGTNRRSYMYASDLAIWLWTILINGENNTPYNVGSDDSYSLAEIAHIAQCLNSRVTKIKIEGKKDPLKSVEQYVPNINKAKDELGLKVNIDMHTTIEKMYQFYL